MKPWRYESVTDSREGPDGLIRRSKIAVDGRLRPVLEYARPLSKEDCQMYGLVPAFDPEDRARLAQAVAGRIRAAFPDADALQDEDLDGWAASMTASCIHEFATSVGNWSVFMNLVRVALRSDQPPDVNQTTDPVRESTGGSMDQAAKDEAYRRRYAEALVHSPTLSALTEMTAGLPFDIKDESDLKNAIGITLNPLIVALDENRIQFDDDDDFGYFLGLMSVGPSGWRWSWAAPQPGTLPCNDGGSTR